MDPASEALPNDVAALKAALIAERARRLAVAAELAVAQAKASEDMALIAAQKLRIAKLERQVFGQRSERSARLIDQLALEFEELAASATEDELAAEQAAAKTTTVRPFTRRRAERDTFPDHLPRERVVIDSPTACACCGGNRLRKLGEDVTQTLETTPRRWKVIETVREKFSCRDCEKISQAPAPFHVVPRGWAGPSLLAMIVFEKFGQHQPLNRQAERYALEGAPVALSTMAEAVGAVSSHHGFGDSTTAARPSAAAPGAWPGAPIGKAIGHGLEDRSFAHDLASRRLVSATGDLPGWCSERGRLRLCS